MAGPWEKYAGQQGGTSGPDPFKVEDQNIQREQANRAAHQAEVANANAANQIALARERFDFEKRMASQKNNLSPTERANAVAGYTSAAQLEGVIKDLEALYKAGPGSTSGVQGLADYLPFTENQQFDNAGNAARGIVGQALGFTGGQLNSVQEAQMAVGPYLPQSDDRDAVIQDKIRRLKDLAQTARHRSITMLGGIPDANGVVTPVNGEQTPQLSPQARGTAMGTTQTEIAKGGQESIPVPPSLSAGLEGYLRARRGQQVDSQDFAAFYNDLAKRNNYPGGTPESLNAYIKQFNQTGTIGPIAPQKQDIGALQQGYNQLAMTPWGTRTLRSANAMAGGIPELIGGQPVSDGLRELSTLNPKSALAGDVFGGVAGTLGAGKGLSMAGLSAPKALTLANLTNSTLFGAAQNPENRLAGAAIGFGAGAVGDAAGGYIAAPAIEALSRKPVNMALQAFGKQPLPVAPNLSGAERTIINTVGDQGRAVTNMLGNASTLGLPMTLADTTEGLRSLAGATARRSPVARDTARNVMEPRALGQIDRLQGALSRDFGDPTNVLERSDALLKQAQTNSAPLYQEAFSAPGASSVETGDILGTPAGKQALARARTQMLNDRKDPTALGIDLNDAGEPVLTRVPSFETLDYVKKGFDDIANEGRTPFGTFQPNAEQSSAASLASDLRGRIDEVNPAYGQARAEYAGPAGERQALTMGKADINKPAESVAYTLKNMPETRQGQYRLGQLSGISEQANRARYSANPYDVVAGSPEAQKRLSVLFPENAARFIQQADLERQMAQSRNQILGGSPTALNQRADEAFDVPLGATLAIDGASAMLAGAPPIATGTRLLGGFTKDAMKLGIGKKKAEALAPLLFSPDAATSAAAFQELTKNARRANVFGKAAKRRRGIFGGVTGGAVGAGATSEMQ